MIWIDVWIYVILVYFIVLVFFFKQKTAYEVRISDWSSDVCSSDLARLTVAENLALAERQRHPRREFVDALFPDLVQRRAQMAGTLSGGQQQMVSVAQIGRASCRESVSQYG